MVVTAPSVRTAFCSSVFLVRQAEHDWRNSSVTTFVPFHKKLAGQSHLPIWWLFVDTFSYHTDLLNMLSVLIRGTKEIIFSSKTMIFTHLSEQLLSSIIQIGSCWESFSCNFPCCNLSLLNWFALAVEGSLTHRQDGPSKDNLCHRPLVFRGDRRLQWYHL